MANLKISQLTSGSPAQTGDLFPIDRSGSNFSIDCSSLVLTNPTSDQTITGQHSLIFLGDDVSLTNGTIIQIGNDNPFLTERGYIRVTPYSTMGLVAGVNDDGFGGLVMYPELDPGNGVMLGGGPGLYGMYGAMQLDSGHANVVTGVYGYAENDSTDTTQTAWTTAFYANSCYVGANNSPNQAGMFISDQRGLGTTANNTFALWADEISGSGTTDYYEWFDSRGVYRIKQDATHNAVAQAVPAHYNPQFTKYTPGAANYERITQYWDSNIGVFGTEKGGTGAFRQLQLIGADVIQPDAIFTQAAPTVSTAQVGLGSTHATGATAGGGQAVPLTVLGYLVANVEGTTVKIPYFAN